MPQRSIVDIIDDAVAANSIDGASGLVLRDGNVIAEHAAGKVLGAPPTADSVWWLASITKTFVVAAVMQLVEKGSVSLEAPIETYIPAFAAPRRVRRIAPGTHFQPAPPFAAEDPNSWVYEPAARRLTVRDFITGTSGLQTIGVPNLDIRPITADDTLETFVDSLAEAPLDFQPGERWHYSNATGFEVVARVVEAASGMPFASYVQDRIFSPLGMTSTAFGVPESIADRALPLHPFIASHPMISGFPSGSAGLFGTAPDLARFAMMMLEGGAVREERVLSTDSVRAMTANQIGDLRLGGINAMQYGGFPRVSNPGVAYGYGVARILDAEAAQVGVPAGSYGWDGIGSRRWWAVPSASSVIVMLVEAADPESADAVHRQIERVALAGLPA
jgi:CubicO group peptidase (beta-lactamase class C family)